MRKIGLLFALTLVVGGIAVFASIPALRSETYWLWLLQTATSAVLIAAGVITCGIPVGGGSATARMNGRLCDYSGFAAVLVGMFFFVNADQYDQSFEEVASISGTALYIISGLLVANGIFQLAWLGRRVEAQE